MKKSLKKVTMLMAAGMVMSSFGTIPAVLAQEEQEYKIATVRWSDWGMDFTNGFVTDSQKDFGVKVNWDVYVNADWADQKAVLMASGDLPDAFLGSNALGDSEIMQNAALFLPLEDLIEEHMPNLTAAMKAEPKLRAIATAPDGHIYGLPTKLPMRPTVGNQLFINKTWLENLGLEMPQTFDEFMEVLRAFKAEDANGNGDKNDEIPFGGGNFDPVYSFILPFGVRHGYEYDMTLVDGKPQYTRTMDQYKQGVAKMHEAFKEGLIDPEIFTQDTSMAEAKRQDTEAARVGVTSGWTADALFGQNSDQYVALPALEGPDGKRYVESDPDHLNYNRNEFLIMKNTKNPEKLLQWLDTWYTEDASIQNFYGTFGVATEKKEDGTYEVLPPVGGETADISAWVNSLRDFGPKYVGDDFNSKVTIDKTQGDGLKLELDKELAEHALPAFPRVSYTADEIGRLSTMYIDLSSYAAQTVTKWVTEGGIEDEWDGYVQQLNQMGFEDFQMIMNDAYNRYQDALGE
ncbi:extracellular solute-binding protein [Tuanshanicoccus lijuaniae]|uniref:sugar ABC transporter substrate-binding protein n=2 Tax=Aerococcaceae bacterium zg-1292 TaxID=2774330 RepID=UPI001935D4FE|nr:extracellular solute-binding protein [Aerococcaceae bacterium zg-1292]QQA36526.1 extracellular solute-binding protein [Aerococcaceae bacterium zg-1292]